MNITVNGTLKDLTAGTSLTDVVADVTTATKGVAVAVNGTVVPKGAWETAQLNPGDRIEILTAVQGG